MVLLSASVSAWSPSDLGAAHIFRRCKISPLPFPAESQGCWAADAADGGCLPLIYRINWPCWHGKEAPIHGKVWDQQKRALAERAQFLKTTSDLCSSPASARSRTKWYREDPHSHSGSDGTHSLAGSDAFGLGGAILSRDPQRGPGNSLAWKTNSPVFPCRGWCTCKG